MAERFTIVVHPAPEGPADLTVRDAMQQILDIVELLDRAGSTDNSNTPRVIWRVKEATTNSPLRLQAESTSSDPEVSVAMIASQAKKILGDSLSVLFETGVVPIWMDRPTLKVTKRVLERNLNGIGRTEIDLEHEGPTVQISPRVARSAHTAIDMALLTTASEVESLAHSEFGSAEGDIVAATTYYGRPTLLLKERLTGDRITCVLSPDAAEKMGLQQNLKSVWEGRRVIVHGTLHFNEDGHITKVDADDTEHIATTYVDLNEVRALDLTDGKSPNEYLDYVRSMELG